MTFKTKRIKTLEALRAIAFLGVFFSHTTLANGYFDKTGYWAVSIFFVLSGFVAVYSQINKDFCPSIKNNFIYALNKIKRLYPIHIFTCLLFFLVNFIGHNFVSVKRAVIQLLLNFLLIQDWFPLKNRSFVLPAWYLCTMMLFYFIFPWFIQKIKFKYTNGKAIVSVIVCIFAEVAIGLIGSNLPHLMYSSDMLYDYDLMRWFVYHFPLCRLVDILIGCNIGYLFLNHTDKIISFATLKEFIGFILGAIAIYLASSTTADSLIGQIDYSIWWSKSIIFLPSSILLVYLFAYGQGWISKLLVNPFNMYLAKISPYGFLIHYTVLIFFDKLIYIILGDQNAGLFLNLYGGYFKLTLGFIITLVATQLWIAISNKMFKN